MCQLSIAAPARWVAVLIVVCAMATAYAQNPGAGAAAGQTPAQTAAGEYDAMLARAAKLYYSSTKEGLSGFTCAVHPDWHALFESAQPGAAISSADERIALLNSVKITLHARMKGGSTMDWEPAADPSNTLDHDSTTLLTNMHQATEQTFQGFLQFWTPFVDGSAIPESSAGLDIAPAGNGFSLHSKQDGTEVTEILGSSLLLEHFDVDLNGSSVKFVPSYQSTAKGLLVTGFQAQIRQQGASPEQTQEMRVGIEYKTVEGLPIPAQLNMQVIGTGVFNFALDACAVSKQAN
jgi:hypothetical protein